MTPTSSNKRQSGNPATQAKIELTVKQQRDLQKREKLAEYQRQVARRRRTGLMWWIVGGTAGLVIVGLIVASLVFGPKAAPSYSAGGDGAQIEGVERFSNETQHVEGTVDYPQTPPAGGAHNQYWLNCGVYDQPQVNENAVHSLEHGAIWVTYDADAVSAEDLDALKAQLPSTYVLLSPFDGLPAPIVLSAWNAQLQLDSATDARIPTFFEEFWRNQNVPEPTAICSGAIDGPGKQS
ncbi:DUF3105 domain-containing protein [Microbacterium memoriense]|uniref:DUF3105 domain-containing protein n=1 Tax=Microbacterium memoriense TaxID=2978350 RepID=A0ABT2PEC4_9MICO|nr:DUF3105 domain-containing protein [Microbacterium memoriense]MCT9002159.1 DUF3105 domain-containing protein [Microbacterium memoriense]